MCDLQALFAKIEQLSHKVDEQRQGPHLPGRCSEKIASEELERCRSPFALIAQCKAHVLCMGALPSAYTSMREILAADCAAQ